MSMCFMQDVFKWEMCEQKLLNLLTHQTSLGAAGE